MLLDKDIDKILFGAVVNRNTCIVAMEYLKSIDKYDEFMANKTSTDGWSLVQYAQVYYMKKMQGIVI